ncbi:MAG: type II toxin-antitoxin system Phd/YefM family antitoxin [Pseudomonadota bacterium]
MPITTLSSRELNRNSGKAKRATQLGPVVITDRGRPAHVLLTFEHYQKLASPFVRITDMLAMSNEDEIEFEPVGAKNLYRPAGLF